MRTDTIFYQLFLTFPNLLFELIEKPLADSEYYQFISEEIKEKMAEADVITKEIEVQSELYRPVAKRASLLYFVIADLGFVDPMYQYSLQWFQRLFSAGVKNSQPDDDQDVRITNLKDYFTLSLY